RDRFPGGQPVTDVRHGAGQVLLVVAVEQRGMNERLLHWEDAHATISVSELPARPVARVRRTLDNRPTPTRSRTVSISARAPVRCTPAGACSASRPSRAALPASANHPPIV